MHIDHFQPCYINTGGEIDLLEETRRRVKICQAAHNDRGFARELYAACSEDVHLWWDTFAWTYDQNVPEGEDQHVPFVPYDFQRDFINAFLGIGEHARTTSGRLFPLAVDKSRELGLSWLVMGAMGWDWVFHKGANYFVMSLRGGEVDGEGTKPLFGKLAYLLKWLPPWMLPPESPTTRDTWRRKRGNQPVFVNFMTDDSVIEGSTTTPDSGRGGRFKRLVVDEAGMITFLDDMLASSSAASKSACLISTPRGLANTFAKVIHSQDGYRIQPFGKPGAGWRHLRFHYAQHPHRIPGTPRGDAWRAEEETRYTEEQWAQEQEISYNKSAEGRIFKRFDRTKHVYSYEEWSHYAASMAAGTLYEGWDFGVISLTFVVWGRYFPSVDRLYVMDYRPWRETLVDEMVQDVADAGYYCSLNRGGLRPHARCGDPYGGRIERDLRSWFTDLLEYDIEMEGTPITDIEKLWHLMNRKFRDGLIVFSPQCLERHGRHPTLVESVEQYVRMPAGKLDVDRPAKKDVFSHGSDALQIICWRIWGATLARKVQQDRPQNAYEYTY